MSVSVSSHSVPSPASARRPGSCALHVPFCCIVSASYTFTASRDGFVANSVLSSAARPPTSAFCSPTSERAGAATSFIIMKLAAIRARPVSARPPGATCGAARNGAGCFRSPIVRREMPNHCLPLSGQMPGDCRWPRSLPTPIATYAYLLFTAIALPPRLPQPCVPPAKPSIFPSW